MYTFSEFYYQDGNTQDFQLLTSDVQNCYRCEGETFDLSLQSCPDLQIELCNYESVVHAGLLNIDTLKAHAEYVDLK